MQACSLLVGELNFVPEAEAFCEQCLNVFPLQVVTFFLAQFVYHLCESTYGLALVLQHIEVQFIRAASQNESAGFVVCGYDYECFVGMLLVEFISYLYGFVHVDYFGYHGGCVVRVAAPVDSTAFEHEEETVFFLVHQEIYSAFCNLLECKVVIAAVEGVRQARLVLFACLFGLEKYHALRCCFLCLVIGEPACYGISGLFGKFVQVLIVLYRLKEIRSGKEVEIRLC